jgi:hypothetical protein
MEPSVVREIGDEDHPAKDDDRLVGENAQVLEAEVA